MISGQPEKESTIRLLDMQLKSSEMENRDPIEALKWQYYVTNGVVIKATNQDFDESSIMTALISVKIFVDFAKPMLVNHTNKDFFEIAIKKVKFYIDQLVNGSSINDKQKSQIIIDCTDITGKVYSYISKLGDSIVVDKDGVDM